MKPKKPNYPRTKFQLWLAEHGACCPGRRAVGMKTYEEFVRTTRSASYLRWLIVHHIAARRSLSENVYLPEFYGQPISYYRTVLFNAGRPY